MIRHIFGIISIFLSIFGVFFLSPMIFGATMYTPAAQISLTGANDKVYFHVAEAIYNSGGLVSAPVLDTVTRTFSGAFYLSGAGWVDFSTGSYSVSLDCGIQSLANLSAPCTLSGVAYSEMIGDILFDRRVSFDPEIGYLSGTASTYIGEYSFSGIILPLLPVVFTEGNSVSADHMKYLSFSGGYRYFGPGVWRVHIEPLGGVDILYTDPPYDLSHASIYRVEILDPNGSSTVIDDFSVFSGIPDANLDIDLLLTVRQYFCTTNPTSLSCPDGNILRPTLLSQSSTATPVVANGTDRYQFTLRLRDRYGNRVDTGDIRIEYRDDVREIQDPGPLPYLSWGPGYAIKSYASLMNGLNGIHSTGDIPANLGDVSYEIASIAPTSITDRLTLSGVIYTDTLGMSSDIAPITWKSSLLFTPWYTTSLSVGPMVAGSSVDFTTHLSSSSPVAPPFFLGAIYDTIIGNNTISAFENFVSSDTISCVKYVGASGIAECDWLPVLYDPVVISTLGSSFSGVYRYGGFDTSDMVRYRSYITYDVSGTRVLYPSIAGNLGVATPGIPRMKILGQQNLSSLTGIGVQNLSDFWNILRKNIALLSRNRSDYSDVSYSVFDGDITVDMTDFMTVPEKHTIITLGGDITLTSDISGGDSPLALIALTSSEGSGGNIIIDPSVIDIKASLIAERSIFSTGANQLYIKGSVISYNTSTDSKCPYYVSPCVNPEQYNLENLRRDFLTTPGTLSSILSGKYSTIPFIIDYDSRILSDPPPGLQK